MLTPASSYEDVCATGKIKHGELKAGGQGDELKETPFQR
jgi:hypothetical protein